MTTTTPAGHDRQTMPGIDSLDALIDGACARSAVTELLYRRDNTIRAEVDDLARKFDIAG